MTNDELRALADALEPMAKAPRFEDMDVPAFCRWLRAQADAQPVAWVDVTDSYEGPYIFHGKELLPAGRHDLYTRPAPAAPQPEPKRPAFLDEIDRAKEHVASWPQWMKDATVSAAATLLVTEPKRDPACLWSRAIERAAYERAAQECDPHEDDDRIDRQIKREIAERIRALGRQ